MKPIKEKIRSNFLKLNKKQQATFALLPNSKSDCSIVYQGVIA
jgi:hypothetical protein